MKIAFDILEWSQANQSIPRFRNGLVVPNSIGYRLSPQLIEWFDQYLTLEESGKVYWDMNENFDQHLTVFWIDVPDHLSVLFKLTWGIPWEVE